MHPILALLAVLPLALATAVPRPAAAQAATAEAAQANMDALFADLAGAETEAEGRAAEDRIWRRWIAGPDPEATALLAEAMGRIRGWDLAGAVTVLDDLTAAYPDWAEPWNQRAHARFLQEKPDAALEDLDRALALEPRHFGALSGKAMILMRMGRMALGQKALREAVRIHPWLKERDMLLPVPEDDA